MDKPVILFPTDTVYGIGTLPKKEALEKIFKIKNRDKNKKIIALVSKKETINKIIKTNNFIDKIIDKFFPGAITIISKSTPFIKNLLGYEDIGVRMPNNKLALEIIEKHGGILMTTSANISGKEAPKTSLEIDDLILNSVDIKYIDDSNLSGITSSIFKIEGEEITLLREGSIPLIEIVKLKEE
ncbi:threonylcarbamoyl-AMP synthase [Streptobacillus felis]|uniref:L-threonylcarbamoyladenylate synthase n=1 Tax=Streptobacillus felis TaxID=1384509 RepID=A0A7Z0TAV1_9FUSO|nr:L-threonylcarbamoyladenylate synthase [Streptobacillus felis]NYV28387.1 threonylcarbamoyl-AMP synthase [Streptobacillus felis]